jgi:hypothetical protein
MLLRAALGAVLATGTGLTLIGSAVAQDNWPRLDGRTIDACIIADAFPSGQQCSDGAKQIIADAYCRDSGYNRATGWETEFTGVFQRSLKLELRADQSTRWRRFDDGAAIFIRISCA